MNDYKQQVTEFFNRRTAYDQEGSLHPRLANLLLECVHLQKGQKILDIATGTGLIAIPAAQMVGAEGYVVGVDMSSGMLNQARQKIEALGLKNIELIEADADYLDLADASFDVIFCSSALVYLANIPAAFKNWYRWLKKGGIVAFSCFSESSFITPIVIKACAKHGVFLPNINEPLGTPERCHNLLQQAGFQDIKVKTEQLGEYLSLNDRRLLWNGRFWFHPTGNPLLQLSQEKTEELQAEYRADVESLATDKGVWFEIATYFVLAQK